MKKLLGCVILSLSLLIIGCSKPVGTTKCQCSCNCGTECRCFFREMSGPNGLVQMKCCNDANCCKGKCDIATSKKKKDC